MLFKYSRKSGVKSAGLRAVFAVAVCILGGLGVPVHAQSTVTLTPLAQLGAQLFFDTNLSASKKMSCATCHDPNNHYAQPVGNTLPVQLGGPALTTPGVRAVPTLTYKQLIPAYSDNAVNPDGVSTSSPGGGFTWDGRADTLATQAAIPLLSSFEMDNASPAAVAAVVQAASYATLLSPAAQQASTQYGTNVSDIATDPTTVFTVIGLALQEYQLEDPDFHPYTSKFDYYADLKLSNGQPVNLTAAEDRGYSAFLDSTRGNCFACHYSGPMGGPSYPSGGDYEFSDFTFQALGVPRNTAIPATATKPGMPATYYDLGLCTAQNPNYPHTLPASAPYCGLFKVPTLRNVATRSVFFHNGVFTSLAQVLLWYNTRDTNPAAWYPTVGGVVQKFNDLPTAYKPNVSGNATLAQAIQQAQAADEQALEEELQPPCNVAGTPGFNLQDAQSCLGWVGSWGLAPGATPAMTPQDLADLQCFLETLTDGYEQGVTPQDPNCVN
jgi:cytochrome c peroxidase